MSVPLLPAPLPALAEPRLTAPSGAVPRQQAGPATPDLTQPAARPVAATIAADAVHQVTARAVQALFPQHDIAIEGFFDDSSSRYVYRVADRHTGEVLAQSPPDELLRFYASTRAAAEPLITVEA
jgi:hypothetical protein